MNAFSAVLCVLKFKRDYNDLLAKDERLQIAQLKNSIIHQGSQ
jgi:hypothetical protein